MARCFKPSRSLQKATQNCELSGEERTAALLVLAVARGKSRFLHELNRHFSSRTGQCAYHLQRSAKPGLCCANVKRLTKNHRGKDSCMWCDGCSRQRLRSMICVFAEDFCIGSMPLTTSLLRETLQSSLTKGCLPKLLNMQQGDGDEFSALIFCARPSASRIWDFQ